ncbi:MAG: PepSY-associated TM helix domain-containing protein [Spongiibacteraceae bacterium]|nr:PepSY-associated TM helix domain-containing protein [Spongiibacteraceae bacterium]
MNKTLLRWSRLLHVYAAIALLLILGFFAFTGITLNHANWFVGKGHERDINFQLQHFSHQQGLYFSPEQIRQLESQLRVSFTELSIEFDDDVAFLDAQMPGRFVSGEIDLRSGQVQASYTRFGIWALFNDLHKGRHTRPFWTFLLDFFSVLTLIFCVSGLVLVFPNKRHRKTSMYVGVATLGVLVLAVAYS